MRARIVFLRSTTIISSLVGKLVVKPDHRRRYHDMSWNCTRYRVI